MNKKIQYFKYSGSLILLIITLKGVVNIATVNKTYATIIGAVLLLIGIWGLFTNMIFVFGVNILQSILHIVGGALGLYYGTKSDGKSYNMWLGWIAAVVGILGFIAPSLLASIFNINTAITWLHIAIAVVSLLIAYTVKN